MTEWEKEEVEIARAVVEESERFVKAPGKFDFHEYRQMERFIGTVQDNTTAEQLWRAIKGKGAFRYFKAAEESGADECGILACGCRPPSAKDWGVKDLRPFLTPPPWHLYPGSFTGHHRGDK